MKLRHLALAGFLGMALTACGAPASGSNQQPPSGSASADLGASAAPAVPVQAAGVALEPAPAASSQPSAAPSDAPPAPAAPAPAKPAVPIAPTAASIRLGPLEYIRQTLNNCGPASIAEVLKFWGVNQTQGQAQAFLRPDGNSRGMMPYPVPAYVHSLGMSSLMGIDGSPALVKALVSNGFPVIVAQAVSATDRTAHYREIEGYDDGRGIFVSTDSYLGPNHEISYPEFDKIWNGNHRFMVVYPPAKQALLDAVLASVSWSKAAAYEADLVKPAFQRPSDAYPSVPNRPDFRAGFKEMNAAWDHIQLGDFAEASTDIQQAAAQGGNGQMLKWLNQALAAAKAEAAA